MIDLEKIGQRIKEQRKYIRKVTQEAMASDLYMSQPDISNMEKAKNGSGITDLVKLDSIAVYLNIPLETLLFGKGSSSMPCYQGTKMQIKASKKRPTRSHLEILHKLTGTPMEDIHPIYYECGPYAILSLIEFQSLFGDETTADDIANKKPEFIMPKLHTYIFLDTEIIGTMVADMTTVMQHVYQHDFAKLSQLIQHDVFDVTDVLRTLNPYWALYYLEDNAEKKAEYMENMVRRMDELRDCGENRPILYVESVYVREDSRMHGLLRMYIDFLRAQYSGAILWLNMEPTSGAELDSEYDMVPCYTVSDIGQLNMNAAIAEKLGFTVDPDVWHKRAEVVDEKGEKRVETVLVRKCAYYLPPEIRSIIKNDGELVAQGRAIQQIKKTDEENAATAELFHGMVDGQQAIEMRMPVGISDCIFVTVIKVSDQKYRYVVSKTDLMHDSKAYVLEEYSTIEEAKESPYYDTIAMVNGFMRINTGSKQLEEVLEKVPFDILGNDSYTIYDEGNSEEYLAYETKIARTSEENKGEILYVFTVLKQDGGYWMMINRKSMETIEEVDFGRVENLAKPEYLDAITMYKEDENPAPEFVPLLYKVLNQLPKI